MRFSRVISALAVFLLIAEPTLAADKGIDARAKQGGPAASSPRRLALVVGNSAYRFSGVLANPARDAELIAQTLKQVGFELHGGGAQTDLSRAALDQAIESFGDSLRAGDVALFYYSGHGLQVAGENYLVPIDAEIKKESEVRVKTVPINLLFAKLEGANAVNIVILDACRNNPFVRSYRSAGNGLAQVNAPAGTIVAFSTSPGQVAEDGSGEHSTYTAALSKALTEPGLLIEEVFKRVRKEVSAKTKGTQMPWENTSLTGNFRFIEGDILLLKKAELAAAEGSQQQQDKELAEIARREAEIARIDAEIVAIRQNLSTSHTMEDNNLQTTLAMVEQREDQAFALARIKGEQKQKRREKADKDIAAYEKIVKSPYGREMAHAAWQKLVGEYPQAIEISEGDVMTFRKLLVPRFEDQSDGTVIDTKSGLVWLKNANCFGMKTWDEAISSARTLASGACGLRDRSKAGQWRLPTKEEWGNIVDRRQKPCLPAGNHFTRIRKGSYWSSSSEKNNATFAWDVYKGKGNIYDSSQDHIRFYVWPVRTGDSDFEHAGGESFRDVVY